MNKAVDSIRFENRQKRGSTTTTGQSIPDWQKISSVEPTPDMVATASDSLECLLMRLDLTGDTDLREIAIASIEGSRPSEIAAALGCTQRTVQRKLKTIQQLWQTDSLP
ncbi:ECF sigma factor [Neorhodopirellula pilleata]|uniref:ECF sigma factor n=2 Tax=Neorhodopirellula pilleata TaxID=2714738 RepID=A0A5C6AV15_9BACT|nr:ECF sigma factor [Neorhodopirellula pilleata]